MTPKGYEKINAALGNFRVDPGTKYYVDYKPDEGEDLPFVTIGPESPKKLRPARVLNALAKAGLLARQGKLGMVSGTSDELPKLKKFAINETSITFLDLNTRDTKGNVQHPYLD